MTTEIKRDDEVYSGIENVRQASRIALKDFRKDYPDAFIESFSVWKHSENGNTGYKYRIKAKA